MKCKQPLNLIKFSLFILSRFETVFFFQANFTLIWKFTLYNSQGFSLSNHVIWYDVFSYPPQIPSFQSSCVCFFVILSTAVQPLSPAVTPRYSQVPSTILTRNNILTPANLLDASSVNKPAMLLSRFIKDRGEMPSPEWPRSYFERRRKGLVFYTTSCWSWCTHYRRQDGGPIGRLSSSGNVFLYI